jgi:putative ATP-dependent endonuclease of OLD family
MHITELRIRNYRNFHKATFRFRPGVNTMIGENGSGKTNVFQALRLLLDEGLERNAVYLREADFCRASGEWRGQWVIIAATFANLDTSEGCQLLRHAAGHMNGTNTGTCMYLFRPKKEVRRKLFELNRDRVGAKAYRASLTVNDYEAVLTGRASGDFLDEATYLSWTGDYKTAFFPDPDKDDTHQVGVRIPPIYQEIACTFVRALRDVISDLRGFRGNPLLALLRGMENDIHVAKASTITDQVKKLNDDISALDEIKTLARDIEEALKSAVGHTYGPDVDITSSLPDTMERLLQRLGVLVGDGAPSGYKGELHEQSLGAANLIYLSLKLLEYERKRSTDRVAHFFLIEEPEAHIHTHIQKTLFANLPCENTQVIVSTHSTHISSAAKIESVNVLAKKDDHAVVYQPAEGLSAPEQKRIERYLDAVRSTLLFAKGVLLVEGDAELIMIPAMLKAVFGTTSDELGFSVVSMSAAFFEHISMLFAESRIRRSCAILTDGDAPFVKLPSDPKKDTPEQAHARAAELAGQLRREVLEDAAKNNAWVKPFFAEATFEVDFVHDCNAEAIVRTLNAIYKDPRAKAASSLALRSAEDGVAATETLRLANKEGKGWFAVLLAENLDIWTQIPSYILEAVAFACHESIQPRALRRIAEYRVNSIAATNDPLRHSLIGLQGQINLTAPQYLAAFEQALPNDELTVFCSFIRAFQNK